VLLIEICAWDWKKSHIFNYISHQLTVNQVVSNDFR